ncbi:hypothetical protein FCM35_KLT13929 [Carex littledalei]|uniref:Uncharacterized protein n=1 Tax=Carex littledalei TaxID=544730 RepID=A0A833QL16_9POAL|nr:hypothetical protein FCM35_KLT13929 [Carex littledalei]
MYSYFFPPWLPIKCAWSSFKSSEEREREREIISCFSRKSWAKVFSIKSTPNPEEDKEKQENMIKKKKQGNPQKTKEIKQRSNLDTAAATTPYFAFHSRPGLR